MRFERLRVRAFTLAMWCALLSVGCGAGGETVTLKLAHGLATSHPVHQAMEFMARKALEKSDSTLVIEIYPNEQLGNEKESLEKLQLGAIALTNVQQYVGKLSRGVQGLRPAISVQR